MPTAAIRMQISEESKGRCHVDAESPIDQPTPSGNGTARKPPAYGLSRRSSICFADDAASPARAKGRSRRSGRVLLRVSAPTCMSQQCGSWLCDLDGVCLLLAADEEGFGLPQVLGGSRGTEGSSSAVAALSPLARLNRCVQPTDDDLERAASPTVSPFLGCYNYATSLSRTGIQQLGKHGIDSPVVSVLS